MPSAPLRFCAAPGCPSRVVSGYCAEHQRPRKAQHSRFYTGGGVYYDHRWRRARVAFLAEHPFCVGYRAEPGHAALATVLDHRNPHRGDHGLFWDETNWQGLCVACHGRKTADEVWRR